MLVILAAVAGARAAAAWETNDWQFLETMQRANLRFFEEQKRGPYLLLNDTADYDNPNWNGWSQVTSVAGVGFELTAICLGHYRGWISYSNAYEQVLQQVRAFNGLLSDDPDVFHRVNGWTHHMYHTAGDDAGKPYPGIDELSLLDHSFFIAGCIFVAEYFKGTEAGILAHKLYEETTWSWRPNVDYHFGYSENLLSIIQSAEAPAFAKGVEAYNMWRDYCFPPWPRELDLYFWEYPHSWVDFRFRTDAQRGDNHAIVAQQGIEHMRQAAIDLHNNDPVTYDMIGTNCWGWTAATGSGWYRRMAPWSILGSNDVEWCSDSGSVTPFALPPAMVYAPVETMAAMKHIFEEFYINGWDPAKGERGVWSPVYGWINCFNKGKPYAYHENPAISNWFHPVNAAIDYGPNVLMLENYKLGTTWRYFMQNPYIATGMYTVGFGPPQNVTLATFDGAANAFGGGLGHWENDATPVDASYATADFTNDFVGGEVVRFAADNAGEGGWIELGACDQRAQAQLTFWARCGGGETIEVGLKDTLGRENKVLLAEFCGGQTPTNWTEVKIPLERFCLVGDVANDTWPGGLDLVSFAFLNAGGGTLDVDHLAFTRDTLAPRLPTNGFAVAGAGARGRVGWNPAGAERDVVGYHVWRRFDATSDFTRVTSTLVPAYKGRFDDTNVVLGLGQEVRYAIQAADNAEPQNFSPFALELVALGGQLDVDWGNGSNPNALGGSNDGYWGDPTDQGFGFVYTNDPDDNLAWVRRSYVTSPWAGHWIDLNGADAADFEALSFWVRGAAGGELAFVGLQGTGGGERKIPLHLLLPSGAVGTNWQHVIVPLSEFTNVNMASLFNLTITHETPNDLFVARIAFLAGARDTLSGRIECEAFDAQDGSEGFDAKPGASGGAVLGSSWGLPADSFAVYSNVVSGAHTGAWFHLWYAQDRNAYDGRLVELYIDGELRARLACPPTAGWGSRAGDFVRVSARIGPLAAGPHTVSLVAPGAGSPLNLDCFHLGVEEPGPAGLDADGDGLADRQEGLAGSDASMADSDGDGIPDGDETQFGIHGQVSNPTLFDSDSDGMSDLEEAIAGTAPENPNSHFELSVSPVPVAEGVLIAWPSVTGRLYNLQHAPAGTDAAFSNKAAGIPAAPPVNVYTDSVSGADASLYRVGVYR